MGDSPVPKRYSRLTMDGDASDGIFGRASRCGLQGYTDEKPKNNDKYP